MQAAPGSIFEYPQVRHLLDEEAHFAQRCARSVATGPVLSIAPLPSLEHAPMAMRAPASRLHVAADRLAGDVACAPHALPWPSGHFQFVLARHAIELLPQGCGIEEELARVLAPGGKLVVSGMNPWSPWRLWLSRRGRDGAEVPTLQQAAPTLRALERAGLDVVGLDFVGGAWPRKLSNRAAAGATPPGFAWHGAWMLVTRKQEVAMRPIPFRGRVPKARLGHALAPASSQRHCA